jgi:glycosyltransferase involved in cell wall biosynthesis
MNALILCTHLNAGGISRYVLNLAKGLKANGHNVYVASSGGEWLYKLKEVGIQHKYIIIRTKSICSPKIVLSFFILLPFMLKNKIQIVHGNTRVTQFLAFLLYKASGIPYVSSFHGFHRSTCFRKLYKFSGLRTIAVSEAVRKHLSEDLRIESDKIRVVYNGVDRDEFAFRRKSKIDYGFKEGDFLIGILGRISSEKGHFLAAEAFKLLVFEYENIYLLISGRGRLEREIKLFFRLVGIENKVRFLDLEAKDFLDIPDLLIVPSKKEGFGYAVIEAFLKGIPVIGFNVGGIAEIIKDRENGILFYKYDGLALQQAIEEIMLNKILRQKLVEKAKKDANFFSLERMALDTEKVYKEILQ